MGINGPDNNIVEGFGKLWHEASIHNVEKGQTSGINKEEFDGMSMFLNDAINNASASEETINWAQKKLHDLNRMKQSIFNKENLKSDVESSPNGLLENIKGVFTKTEKDYYEENVISYSTMLTYNGGGIEAIEEEDKKRGGIFGFEFGGFGSGSIFTTPLSKSEE